MGPKLTESKRQGASAANQSPVCPASSMLHYRQFSSVEISTQSPYQSFFTTKFSKINSINNFLLTLFQ